MKASLVFHLFIIDILESIYAIFIVVKTRLKKILLQLNAIKLLGRHF